MTGFASCVVHSLGEQVFEIERHARYFTVSGSSRFDHVSNQIRRTSIPAASACDAVLSPSPACTTESAHSGA